MKIKKTKKNPIGTKVVKEITFQLTETEFAEKGKAAAALRQDINELTLQFEEVKENWNAKLKVRKAKRDEILDVIHAKKEKRNVDCILVKDFDAKEVQYWFEGDIVEKRTMTEGELQLELNPAGVAKKARAIKQKLQKPDSTQNLSSMPHAANGADPEIADVIKEETGRRTKLSAVDGFRQ